MQKSIDQPLSGVVLYVLYIFTQCFFKAPTIPHWDGKRLGNEAEQRL